MTTPTQQHQSPPTAQESSPGVLGPTLLVLSVMICLIVGTAVADLDAGRIVAIGTATAAIITVALRYLWSRR